MAFRLVVSCAFFNKNMTLPLGAISLTAFRVSAFSIAPINVVLGLGGWVGGWGGGGCGVSC